MLAVLVMTALTQTGGLGIQGREEAPKVYVHIESDNPNIQLFRHLGTSVGAVSTYRGSATVVVNSFNTECTAPCDAHIPYPSDKFYLGGGGATASEAFSLTGHGNSLTLKVSAGSGLQSWLGVTLVVVGATTALTAGTLFLVHLLVNGLSSPGVQNPYGGGSSLLGDLGLWGMVGGGAALAGGIPLIAFSGTKVEFLPGPKMTVPVSNPDSREL